MNKCSMTFEKVHYLPIFIAVWFPITFILTYCIAIANENVTPLFPYISDTGTFSPESCIFGQFLNLGAMMIALISYMRYLQLRDLIENREIHVNVQKLNWPSCIMGFISALGISVVGNFQEKNALAVHLTGAVMAFGVGGVYIVIQSYISFKIHDQMGNRKLNILRVFLAAGTLIFFVTTFLFAAIAFENGPKRPIGGINTHWKPGEPGWNWHFCSTLSEWLLAFCLLIYLSSFAYDFKKISLTPPVVKNKLKS